MKEVDMYKQLKKSYNEMVMNGIICRIESPISGNGIPDVYYRSTYYEGWIELKQLQQRKTHWKVPFQPGQFAWLQRYHVLNGHSSLVATIDEEWFLFSGADIKEQYPEENLIFFATTPIDIIRDLITR